MKPHTFIFIGRSGSGKGTQAALLEQYLRRVDPEKDIFRLETGKIFREFIEGKNYTSSLSAKIYADGGLQPEFLSVWIFAKGFIEGLKKTDHIIVDGSPRRVNEAVIFDTAMEFYSREKPKVIYMDVGSKWAEEHLKLRGRMDDTSIEIKKRMEWFEQNVIPTVEFFKKNSKYDFFDINGEQPIEGVHQEIVTKVFHGNH